MFRYEEFRYLWPPRPEQAIARPMFSFYERSGWICQLKLNGACSVIFVPPNREMFAWGRHNEPHKAWQANDASRSAFRNLPGEGWYVFVAELMHSKVPGIRNINYIFDILVNDGDYLVTTTLAERQAMLTNLFETHETTLSHHVIDDNTWLVRNYTEGFEELFDSLDRPEYEGLVFKNPKAKLAYCEKEGGNTKWQVKHRKPHKNFTF